MAENAKRQKYGNHTVIPFAIEAHGRWGESALELVRQLSAHSDDESERNNNYHHAIQRIATTLQRHNARTLIEHLEL